MITQIEKTENLLEEFNINLRRTAIDGEKLSITFLTFKKVREDMTNANIGEFVGTIDVLYPVAGLNVALTLDVHHNLCEDFFEIETGMIKLPFVDELVSIAELEYEVYHQPVFEEIEETYEKCSCGGEWRPMYDEFPDWIKFCTKCDSRTEDVDYSPMPY
ncbi:hypothetical protein ABD87_22730 [Lysinibacillus sphaericus]|uniref:hypothetical protein n=1 Tax=Lysinibacillus sphaericus TaxID=1421 RepID=UPI0018CDFEAF|nr:hypothetical protein [Lysinibacillus sphaericus]MBG9732243.1 hypothetical protein [Lysinibacillus sphaericus]